MPEISRNDWVDRHLDAQPRYDHDPLAGARARVVEFYRPFEMFLPDDSLSTSDLDHTNPFYCAARGFEARILMRKAERLVARLTKAQYQDDWDTSNHEHKLESFRKCLEVHEEVETEEEAENIFTEDEIKPLMEALEAAEKAAEAVEDVAKPLLDPLKEAVTKALADQGKLTQEQVDWLEECKRCIEQDEPPWEIDLEKSLIDDQFPDNIENNPELADMRAAFRAALEGLPGTKLQALKFLEPSFVALRQAATDLREKADESYANAPRRFTQIETGTKLKTAGMIATLVTSLITVGFVAARHTSLKAHLPEGLTRFPLALLAAPPAVSLALWAYGSRWEQQAAADYIKAVFVDVQVKRLYRSGWWYKDKKVRARILDRHPNHPALRRQLDRLLPEPSLRGLK